LLGPSVQGLQTEEAAREGTMLPQQTPMCCEPEVAPRTLSYLTDGDLDISMASMNIDSEDSEVGPTVISTVLSL